MTRVLLVEPGPDFSVADVSNGWKAGLEANGCDVKVFPMGHWVAWMSAASQAIDDPDTTDHQAAQLVQPMLRGAALDWWPDLVVVVSVHLVAIASWYLIEKPAMSLKDWTPRWLAAVMRSCSPLTDKVKGRLVNPDFSSTRFADTLRIREVSQP